MAFHFSGRATTSAPVAAPFAPSPSAPSRFRALFGRPVLRKPGGLLFAAGFLTPLAALGMTIVMLNAIAVVHWSKGFFNSNGGLEFPLLLATTAVAVAAIGPGRFSVDRAIGWDDNISGVWWGAGVAAAALAISALTVATTRRRARVQAAATA